jgi:hypothetical protein
MDGPLAGLGVHAQAKEALELHLLAHEPSGDGDRLSADGNLRFVKIHTYCKKLTTVTSCNNNFLHSITPALAVVLSSVVGAGGAPTATHWLAS